MRDGSKDGRGVRVQVHLTVSPPQAVAEVDRIITAALKAAGMSTTPPRSRHLRAVPNAARDPKRPAP